MSAAAPPRLSVVVLCYKSGHGAPKFCAQVIDTLNRIMDDWEVVLVGNYHEGKDDPTPVVLRNLAATDNRIKTLTLVKQGMMGWDARMGLEAATGQALALIDGDFQMPPEDIASVYRVLIEEGCDIAMTYRAVRKDGLLRIINSRIYNLVFRLLFPGYGVRDVNSKPKVMTRSLYERMRLTADDWFLDAEIIIQARRMGARLGQIPTVFLASMDRRSFVRPDALLQFARNLIKARFREFRKRP